MKAVFFVTILMASIASFANDQVQRGNSKVCENSQTLAALQQVSARLIAQVLVNEDAETTLHNTEKFFVCADYNLEDAARLAKDYAKLTKKEFAAKILSQHGWEAPSYVKDCIK